MLHEGFKDRRMAELGAETTAYVACSSPGLDASDYSFGYVANWAGGGNWVIAGIKASCEQIQKTTTSIPRSFEEDEQAVG